MSKLYRTREGEVTAIDTKTQLSTLGSEASPGPLLVPSTAKKLLGFIVAECENFAAAASYSAFLRLEGPGLPQGPETIAVGSGGVPVATGGNGNKVARFIPFELDVVPANEILVFAEIGGADPGQVSFGVTLVFES